MNIPIPPTDNLYKFEALVGTIIVFASLYFPRVLLIKLDEEVDAATIKIGTAEAELKFATRKEATISKILDNAVAPKKSISEFDGKKVVLEYSESELKGMLAQIEELERSMRISDVEVKVGQQRMERLLKDFKWVEREMYCASIVGLIMALTGYSLWYWRIQVYQDKALKRSANEPNAAA